MRAWRTCFLFVCEELDPYMIFCLAHFQNLPQLSKVTEFNTHLNTRDRQMSSNVCLLKLKEKQQHIKNAIRSQSMASLSQIPVLKKFVCKKGKQKNATCTLDCNNPKVPLHTKGLYLYKSSEIIYNKFTCKKIFTPHPLPPAPKVGLHAQLINKNKNKFTVASQLLHLMRQGNKNKTAKQRKGGRGVVLCPCYFHLLQSLQSTCLFCTSLHSDVKVHKQPLER